MKKDRKQFKMTDEELQEWLHLNQKAHAIDSKKKYTRKEKHKGRDDE